MDKTYLVNIPGGERLTVIARGVYVERSGALIFWQQGNIGAPTEGMIFAPGQWLTVTAKLDIEEGG